MQSGNRFSSQLPAAAMMSSDSAEKHINNYSCAKLAARSVAAEGYPGVVGDSCCSEFSPSQVPSSRNSLFSKFWRNNENSRSTATVIYENICEGCRYGIFEAEGRFCNFCQFVLSGQIKSPAESIYQNICEKCSEIYDPQTGDCSHCSIRLASCLNAAQESPLGPGQAALEPLGTAVIEKSTVLKPVAGRGVFSDFFGTLKKARSRNSKPRRDADKRRKLEIIHNVDLADYFGEARDELRINNKISIVSQGRSRKGDERRIYGKLRRSDDHLMNSLRAECAIPTSCSGTHNGGNKNNSKSDPNISNVGLSLRHAAVPRIAVVCAATLDNKKCDKAKTRASCGERSSSSPAPLMIQDNVVAWLTSLRRQTHDYCLHYSSDDSISSIKSIPSANFNCCGLLCATTLSSAIDVTSLFVAATSLYPSRVWSEVEATARNGPVNLDERCEDGDSLRSLLLATPNNLRVELMVDDFKRHLMEKRARSKRRAIYVKVHEDEAGLAGEDGGGTRHSKRDALHERNSEFVNDILTAFDTFLNSASESKAGSASEVGGAASSGCNKDRAPEMRGDCDDLQVTLPLWPHKSSGNSLNDDPSDQPIGPVVASLVIAKKGLYAHTRRQCKSEILQSLFNRTDVLVKPSRLRNFLTAVEISKGLDRRLLSIEPNLRVFLSAISNSPYFLRSSQAKLIEMYATAAAVLIASTCSAAEQCAIGHKSAIIPADNSSEDKSDDNSDKKEERASSAPEEDIYQPIWKFRTVGNPRESYQSIEATDDAQSGTGSCDVSIVAPNDSSSLSVEDLSDWETDDEFIFSLEHSSPRNRLLSRLSPQQSKKYPKINKGTSDRGSPASSPRLGERIRALKTSLLKPNSSSQSLASFSSNCSADSVISTSTNNSVTSFNSKGGYAVKTRYQRVCILYSCENPRLRAIVYNYDGSRGEPFPSQFNRNNNRSNSQQYQLKRVSSPVSIQAPKTLGDDTMQGKDGCKEGKARNVPPAKDFIIPLCVQAWKFSLLSVDHLDDEEDMYINRDQMLSVHYDVESNTTTLKKCRSEGNLLEIPQDKKKTFGERFINKFQAVGFFPISPRQMKDKKKLDYVKRRGSIGPYISNTANKAPLFGTTLEQVQLSGNFNVPEFVVDCIGIIEESEFICTDGLYRASGNKVEIDVVKKSLMERYDAKILENQDIHTITGLLKLFFRELKTALIPDDIYNKLPDNLADKENLSSIKDVLYLMPCVSRDTLKYLIRHLTKVASASHTNRMPASNLAIIWGPCILYSSFITPMSIARINTLTKVLIEQYDIIFNERQERLIS